MKTKYYCLITGGSMGIGRAIAFECAKRNMHLLLVALPGEELEQTADMIRQQYQVEVHTLGIDLRAHDAPQKVLGWCHQNDFKVNLLVNNAGIAGTSEFEYSDPDYSQDRIQVNIMALVLLTRWFLPMLKSCPQAYVLNIGSLSAFFAIPYKSVYSATKAFVVSFSKSIRAELKDTTVSVSVVCPNGVETNSGTYARIKSHGFMGQITQISAEDLARLSVSALLKGKSVIIPGIVNKGLLMLSKLLPDRVIQNILSREFRKEVKAGKMKN